MPESVRPAAPPAAGASATPHAPGSVTELLLAYRGGQQAALDELLPLVYEHLRTVARAQLRREARHRAGAHTLSTTALVHEAYFKLADSARLDVADRAQFLGVAARAMRQVLVDHARRFRSQKRGGGVAHLDLDDANVAVEERADMLVALDESLARLAALNPRLAQVIEMRFFGGLTEEETAAALGVTDRTVRRDWVKARAWLHGDMATHGSASVS
jgi:RNA polymerase sigma factor (TIGR02999 family)